MESEHTVCGRRSSLMSSLNGLATEHSVVNRIIQYASKKLMGAVGEFVDRRNAGPPGDIQYFPGALLDEFVDRRNAGPPGDIQYLPSIVEFLLMFDRREYSMSLMDTLDEFCVFRDFEVSTAGSMIYSIFREWSPEHTVCFPLMSCDGLVMNGSVRQRSHSGRARVIQYFPGDDMCWGPENTVCFDSIRFFPFVLKKVLKTPFASRAIPSTCEKAKKRSFKHFVSYSMIRSRCT